MGGGGIEHGKCAEKISALKGLGLPWFPKLQTKLCRAAPGSLGFKAGGRSCCCGSEVTNPTSIHEGCGFDPWLGTGG